MKRFLRDNGLSLVVFTLFFLTFILGQSIAGHLHENEEREDHGQTPLSLAEYLTSNNFWEATTENWESEFLQMFLYVLLTAYLYQRQSRRALAGPQGRIRPEALRELALPCLFPPLPRLLDRPRGQRGGKIQRGAGAPRG